MAKRTTRSTSSKQSRASDTADAFVAAPTPATDQADDRGAASVLDDPAALDNQNRSMASEPSEEEIRMRAYRRYLERGGTHGHDIDDWVEAERELKSL